MRKWALCFVVSSIFYAQSPDLRLETKLTSELETMTMNEQSHEILFQVGNEFWRRGIPLPAAYFLQRAANRGSLAAKSRIAEIERAGQLPAPDLILEFAKYHESRAAQLRVESTKSTKGAKPKRKNGTVAVPVAITQGDLASYPSGGLLVGSRPGKEEKQSGLKSSDDLERRLVVHQLWPLVEDVYASAGLHKLSDTELTHLNAYIKLKLNEIFDIASEIERDKQKEQMRSLPRRRASTFIPSENLIESEIDGDFEGWTGSTIFKLINGQIWQQVEFDYEYEYDFMPKVMIFQTRDGSWKLKVEGIDHPIEVRRLK